MENKEGSPLLSIAMLPWLAHGHISPYLELAKKLTTKNFHIYLCSTPANLESIKTKLSVEYSDSIQLVELHLPCLPQLPEQYHTTNGLPLHLMSTLKQAFDMSSDIGFLNILKTLKPDILIYDFNQPWAPTLAKSCNIPAVEFVTFTPSMTSFYFHYHSFLHDNIGDYPFSEIYLHSYEHEGFQQLRLGDDGRLFECIKRSSKIVLFNTCREIEGKYLDFLEANMGKKMVATGPLVEKPLEDECKDLFTRWLDERDPLSTVFVSFGSEYYCSNEELEEIAMGLELSKVNFIWVVRFPLGKSNTIHHFLPQGFMERVKSRGLVVERWAPQTRILNHPSIGGFVSHCGTSSMMESMSLGVPIIAMPMHLDQPINVRLMVSLGVAMEVKRDGHGKYIRGEIARVVRKVVVEDDGKDLRTKVKEMSCLMLKKGDEDVDGVAKELI
ncbi:hypothetical protein V2J09_013575 [Rumex salicifolius]